MHEMGTHCTDEYVANDLEKHILLKIVNFSIDFGFVF